MKNRNNKIVGCLVLLMGMMFAVSYINPYTGTLTLQELVLQISGSRGDLSLGVSINELLEFSMKMLPTWLLEAYVGIELYKHFCVASIYIFSRCVNRQYWYWKKMMILLRDILLFQCLFLTAIIVTTKMRYEIEVDQQGVICLLEHMVIFTLWIYICTIIINILAIKFGSSISFSIVTMTQMVGIVLFGLKNINNTFLKVNIMARLVLAWSFDERNTICFFVILCLCVLCIGRIVVCKHDLLIEDAEIGGI